MIVVYRMRCPTIAGNQLSLLKFCMASLDPRPEFQVTRGRYLLYYRSGRKNGKWMSLSIRCTSLPQQSQNPKGTKISH
jgi:hypothetical protein